MSDCRFGVSPVNYPDPDGIPVYRQKHKKKTTKNLELTRTVYLPPRVLLIFPILTVISAVKFEYCCSYDSISEVIV